MKEEILKCFSEFLEKQDRLCKLTEDQHLNKYGYSEIHTIVAIKELEEPNVTAIAKFMKMSKSTISKIIQKLMTEDLIYSYQKADNKQKIFYMLTEKGISLYTMHAERHVLWERRDNQFFAEFTEQELNSTTKFMKMYNYYLEQCIEELEKEG